MDKLGKAEWERYFGGGEVFDKHCGTSSERAVEGLGYRSEGFGFDSIKQREPQKNFAREQHDKNNEFRK